MNKPELLAHLVNTTGMIHVQVESVLTDLIGTVTSVLKDGGEVKIHGLGTFTAKLRAGRTGVNPQNPTEKIQIPAVTVAKFKASSALKEALNSKS